MIIPNDFNGDCYAMIYATAFALTSIALLVAIVSIRRSQRYWRQQEKLGAAFERAQEVRIQRPRSLYGERAWSTMTGRRQHSDITLLR